MTGRTGDLAEALTYRGLRAVCAAMRWLGPVRASNLGGAVARSIGPWLPVSRVAKANLAAALPAQSPAERRATVRAVWDNLGRTIAELPGLSGLGFAASGPGWEVLHDPAAVTADVSRGCIYFGGHLANWEVLVATSRLLCDDFGVFYRAAGNKGADRVMRELRAGYGGTWMGQFPKGALGARQALAHLRGHHTLALLADQKTNDGIAVPFFGRTAMTAPALAALALKFDIPLIPARLERLGPARFRVTFEAPLPRPNTGERLADVAAMTLAVNQTLERWIRARPGDWLWLHRRWPKG